jgi:hypothetical protein
MGVSVFGVYELLLCVILIFWELLFELLRSRFTVSVARVAAMLS